MGDKEILRQSDHWKKLEFDIFSKVDEIVTVSEEENRIIKKHFPNKAVTTIPIFLYDDLGDPMYVKPV